jgi:hypothetical protein
MPRPSGNRLALKLLLTLGLLGALAGPALAQADSPEVSRLVAGAAPEVRAALSADRAARAALGQVVVRGKIPAQELGSVLGKPGFAGLAGQTLRALEKVDGVEGVRETLRRVAKAGDQGGLIGPAFEIEVAAAFAGQVKGVGVMVGGHEVDLLLTDGTRVEVKSFPTARQHRGIARKMLAKATDQLVLRSEGGRHPVMLVSNVPLEGGQLASFRGAVGAKSSVVVLAGGALKSQLGPTSSPLDRQGPTRLRTATAAGRTAARTVPRQVARAARQKAKARVRAR